MIGRLQLRYARGDLRQNLGVTISLVVVLALSAFLLATGAMVLERLAGSVGQMFAVAKPPHFLQMHKGPYDTAALESFADRRPEIESWLIEDMLGFDGSALSWERAADGTRGDLSAALIDNLFVTQNDDFDLLLDALDDTVPRPGDGEVYLPVAVARQHGLGAGDTLTVRTDAGPEAFEIAGTVRDAQMASSMSSATRFLVSESDFERLAAAGGSAPEIIVEYRLNDLSALAGLQRAYESDPALPKNGQAVTEAMIRIINVLSDGLVAVAFVFAASLLVAIALLNARFVIRGSLEDEIHEIGAMRAIGLPARTIAGLYLSRYGAIAFVACAIGGALSVIAVRGFTAGIRENFAEAPVTWATVLIPLTALVLMFGVVIGICANTLRQVGRADVVGALIHGSSASGKRAAREARRQAKHAPRSAFAGAHGVQLGWRLMRRDLWSERRDWAILPAVFGLAAILITVPLNLLTTFESPRFVSYLGVPASDVRADVNFVDDGDTISAELRADLKRDPRIETVRPYAGMLYEVPGEGGWEVFRVDVGDHAGTTLMYVEGGAPRAAEIALSTLNAERYGLRPGDALTLRDDQRVWTVTVSGTYQDITNGGYTAKLQGEIGDAADRWTIYAEVAPGHDPALVAEDYGARYPAASVLPMQEYLTQTLAHITGALRGVALITLAFGLGTSALVTVLFLRLRIAKDRQKTGILTTVGFSTREIGGQLRVKAMLTIALGTLAGVLVAATLGETVVSTILASTGMGVRRLAFIPQVWIAYVGYPVLLFATGALGALALTRTPRQDDRSRWLR